MQTGMRGSQPTHPGNITGTLYRKQLAEAGAGHKKATAEIDIDAVKEAARREGWSAGYDAGASAGLIAGWDDSVEFMINAGLVTQDQVDAAVDAYNAKLATDDQAPEA
jgi:hypothetical protein